jgi:hypothetical protein
MADFAFEPQRMWMVIIGKTRTFHPHATASSAGHHLRDVIATQLH